MGFSLNSALLLYAAGSFLGTLSYLVVVVYQQMMGSSLSLLFFSFDYNQLMQNACVSGLCAFIFMFVPFHKYRNLVLSLMPSMAYLIDNKVGFFKFFKKIDLNIFVNYDTVIVVIIFAIFWGFGIDKMLKRGV